MVGLPRSGKSTLTAQMRASGIPVVNRDAIRLALHGQRYLKDAEPMVKLLSSLMIKALFLSGHTKVVYDETNFSQAARDAHKSEDWNTVFYHVPTPLSVCIERAYKTGQPDLEPVLIEMAARWEPFSDDDVVIATDNGSGVYDVQAIDDL